MDCFAIAATGLQSANLRLGASAHNVANLLTPSFRPLRTTQASLPGGGSVATVQQEPAPREVDLAQELLEQSRAALQFLASLRVIGAGAETRGRLIDLLG